MPLRLQTAAFAVEKYAPGEACAAPDPRAYTVCRLPAADAAGAAALLARGYAFLDRVLLLEIDCAGAPPLPLADGLPETCAVCDGEYTREMYELACAAYPQDRRFHMDPVFDSARAAPVIAAYLKDFQRRGLRTYKIFHEQELLGFTVVDEAPPASRPGTCFENVMGVTRPGIRGKMAAPALYRAMLEGQKEKGFRKYWGWVSAANTASLNLHYRLGARATAVCDEYILRPNSKKE